MGTFFKRHKGGNYDLFGTHGYYIPDWKGIFLIIVFICIGVTLGSILTIVATVTSGNSPEVLSAIMPLTYLLMFLPLLIYVSAKSAAHAPWMEPVPLDRNDGFGPLGKAACFVLAMVGTAAMAFALDPLNSILPPMPQMWKDAMEMMTKGPLWAVILSTCVFAPIFEEWLCRGLILRGLLEKYGPVVAIAFSAAFFALLHMNIWQGIAAFSLGCLFGYVYYRTRSLKLTMVMHCTNNLIAVVQTRIPSMQDAESMSDVITNPYIYWALVAAAEVVVVIVVLKFSRVGAEVKGE